MADVALIAIYDILFMTHFAFIIAFCMYYKMNDSEFQGNNKTSGDGQLPSKEYVVDKVEGRDEVIRQKLQWSCGVA